MKTIRVRLADFSYEVLFILQAFGEATCSLIRNAHSLRNHFVTGIGRVRSPFVLHQANDEHRLTVGEGIWLKSMIVLQKESANSNVTIILQFSRPHVGKRILVCFAFHALSLDELAACANERAASYKVLIFLLWL